MLAEAEQSSSAAQRLWTPAIGVAIEAMKEIRGELSDKRLCRLITELSGQVGEAKGMAPPTVDDAESPKPLTAIQLENVRLASQTASKIRKRLGEIKKKGHGAT
ncbi:hypothetical protein [Crystallibacter degradans]|uniref:hypothetical protein n=1 Tax=Crystallibacter degradans TaxID=2726743 RepID=UPI001474A7F9|nr:hypothetical protein [Arthrobacter sp. SF27]NMR28643.1 hypothetical protein [Arthrobacter sp. SF27]